MVPCGSSLLRSDTRRAVVTAIHDLVFEFDMCLDF